MLVKTTTLDKIAQHMADDDFHVLKIDHLFPLAEKIALVDTILKKYKLKNKDTYSTYKGIGLQYENEDNPLYDVVDALLYISKSHKPHFKKAISSRYLKKNEIGEKFMDFFNYFEDVLFLNRGRILVSEPGNSIVEHTDGLCSSALHYVIKTDPEAKIIIEDIEYNLPSDGYFYLINSSRRHYIKNTSSTDRIHIVFPINPPSFKILTTDQFEKMQKFFHQLNIDVKNFKYLKII